MCLMFTLLSKSKVIYFSFFCEWRQTSSCIFLLLWMLKHSFFYNPIQALSSYSASSSSSSLNSTAVRWRWTVNPWRYVAWFQCTFHAFHVALRSFSRQDFEISNRSLHKPSIFLSYTPEHVLWTMQCLCCIDFFFNCCKSS